jgi:hypothetical protein
VVMPVMLWIPGVGFFAGAAAEARITEPSDMHMSNDKTRLSMRFPISFFI